MPSKLAYKLEARNLIGRKEKDDYIREGSDEKTDRSDLDLYERMDEEFKQYGEAWKNQVYNAARDCNVQIRTLDERMKKWRQNYNPEEYLKQKKEDFYAEMDRLEQEIRDYDKLPSHEKRLREATGNSIHDMRSAINALGDMVKDINSGRKSGEHSYGSKYRVCFDRPETPEYDAALEERNMYVNRRIELKKYVEMRHALGRNPKDIDPKGLDSAVKGYKDAKATFNGYNKWQQFWAKMFPAEGNFITKLLDKIVPGHPVLKCSQAYHKMNAYDEALKEIGVDPEHPVDLEPDVEDLSKLEIFGEDLGERTNVEGTPEKTQEPSLEQNLQNTKETTQDLKADLS